MKILTREEIKPGVEGVLLASDEQARELVSTLQKQNLKFVVVTPNKHNDSSIQFECWIVAINDRITKVQRWFMNVGLVPTAPTYVAAGPDTPKIKMTNSNVIVCYGCQKVHFKRGMDDGHRQPWSRTAGSET